MSSKEPADLSEFAFVSHDPLSNSRQATTRRASGNLISPNHCLAEIPCLVMRLCVGIVVCLLSFGRSLAADKAADAAFFENRIRPLLFEHCQKCHSIRTKQRGGLQLDSRKALLEGGDSGPAIDLRNPESSLLLQAVRQTGELRMPPTGRLGSAEIADLEQWIRIGAPWTRLTQSGESATTLHWAFRPFRRPIIPATKRGDWPGNPIDRFILAKLESSGLVPSPATDRRTLIRRLSFALLGLPPSPFEAESFSSDTSSNGYENLVDRLLASPRFGERWARHWMDLVRYADTQGHEFDYPIPNAYQYRDYLIRAFNADVPYRDFVTEHVAGDLVPRPRRHVSLGFNESVLGTGFWFLGEAVHSPVDIRADETDRIDNKIDVFGKTFLALTVGCARCHDHKFDPITAKDYYALCGFVLSTSYRQVRFDTEAEERATAERLAALSDHARPTLSRALAAAWKPTIDQLADILMSAWVKPSAPTTNAIGRFDPELVRRWSQQLQMAKHDADNPFHELAIFGANSKNNPEQKSIEAGRNGSARVIVDFSDATPGNWFHDGATFSPRPVRPGDIRIGRSAGRPIDAIHVRSAVATSANWDALTAAFGVEPEPAKLANWTFAGRSLRTKTFAVGTGKLFYLVSGSGRAYAAVDSHRLINGPLHGALLRSWEGIGKWQWIEHDLSEYKGHRTHIEFSPIAPAELSRRDSIAELAIAMIVESTEPPKALPPLADMASSIDTTFAKSAWNMQRRFQGVLQRLCDNRIAGSPDAAAIAHLANWLVCNSALRLATDDRSIVSADESVQRIIDECNGLLASRRLVSRTAPAILDGNSVDEHVLLRGKHQSLGETAPRRFIAALGGNVPKTEIGSGRLQLAEALLDASRPYAARVMVNRVWHHLMGRGIAATVDDFGALGQPPTHPELLDFLTLEFVAHDWSIKWLVRQIVTSATFQMSTQGVSAAEETDAQNLLLHRMSVRRLEGEAIRDAILSVSGRLDEKMHGPSVPVHLTDHMQGRGRPDRSGPLDGDGRRSVYVAVRRNFLSPMMLAFDAPIPFSTVGRRTVSNVPAQALTLLNDPFVQEQARVWARRLCSCESTDVARIESAFNMAFSRPPTAAEREAAFGFLAAASRNSINTPQSPVEIWTDFCHTLFNVKEFVFLH